MCTSTVLSLDSLDVESSIPVKTTCFRPPGDTPVLRGGTGGGCFPLFVPDSLLPLIAAVVVTVVTELAVTESSRSLLFDRSREEEDWLVLLELLRLFLDPPGVVLRAVPRPAPAGGFSSTLKEQFCYLVAQQKTKHS